MKTLITLLLTTACLLAEDAGAKPAPLPESLKTSWWKATAKLAPLLRDRERIETDIARFCKAQGQQASMDKETEELSCTDAPKPESPVKP